MPRSSLLTSLVLCPALRPRDVVVMDNRSSHKVAGVRDRVEAVGAELLYLPPYPPDLNPIEKAWAKLKQLLRAAAQTFEQAIAELLPAIKAAGRSSTIQDTLPCSIAMRNTH